MAALGDDRCADRPLLHHPFRYWHGPHFPYDVTPLVHLQFAGRQGNPSAVGETITDQFKLYAAPVFDRDQEVSVALGEVEQKRRFACSASA